MAKRRNAFLNQFGELIFTRAQRSLMNQPVHVAEQKGERLGLLLYHLDRKHRERTESNLRIAFPEWDDARVVTTARDVFRHFGRIAGDFLQSPSRTKEDVLKSVHVEGVENYDEALSHGRGALLITGHFGNWERMAHYMVASGRPLSVVARDANQEGVQDKVMQIRQSVGLQVLSRGSSAREILSKLRRNESVAMLPDQNASDAFIPFFGHLCGTVLGPAVLHERTQAPILPIFVWRTGVGQYHCRIERPMIYQSGETDREQIMADVLKCLENAVREHPEQYLWMHDRWKEARRRGLMTPPAAK